MSDGYAVWEGEELKKLREVIREKREFVLGLREKEQAFKRDGFPEEYLVTKRVLWVLWKRKQPDWEKIGKELHTKYTIIWFGDSTWSLCFSLEGEKLDTLWGLLCNPNLEKVLLNPELSSLANRLITERYNAD